MWTFPVMSQLPVDDIQSLKNNVQLFLGGEGNIKSLLKERQRQIERERKGEREGGENRI